MAILINVAIVFVLALIGGLIWAFRQMQQVTPTRQPVQNTIYTNCRGHSVYNACTFLSFRADPDHYQQNANAGQCGDDMPVPEADRFPVQETRPDGAAEFVY